MTNQEQTAEKQEELLDKLREASHQDDALPIEQAADEAHVAEHASGVEQTAEAASEATAPPAEVAAAVEDAAEKPLEQAVGESAAPVSAASESEAESTSAQPTTADSPGDPAADLGAVTSTTEDDTGAAGASYTPTAADADDADPSSTPAAEEAVPAIAQGADGEAGAEGASYSPEAEDDAGGKPRRLKDLEPDMELDGRVTSIALYGIFVDIGVGRDGLVHISEMSDTRIDSPSDMVQIGDVVKVRIKSIDPDARRISLTMRSKERPEGRSRGRKRPDVDSNRLSTLKVGDTVEGTVTGLAPFGAFVDIGVGKDGLVHISELSEGRVDKPEDAVQVGERYTFKLLEVDPEGTRISLSLRKALRGQRMQQLEKGAILDGTVSGLATFGAFVDIGVGRDGLVHISELSEGRVGRVEDAVEVGQKVTVRVLEVDPNSKRISLTMRLEDRPERVERPERPEGAERTERTERTERPSRPERGERPDRGQRQPERVEATTSSEPEEEEVNGNATLEDLVSKFGGSTSGRRDKKRRQDEEEEEDVGDRVNRRQRDAIRRTLQQMGDDD